MEGSSKGQSCEGEEIVMKGGPIFDKLKRFFIDLGESEISKNILNRFDSTIQFRLVDRVKNQPPNWYGHGEGEWYYVEFQEGKPQFGEGDVQADRDWRKTVLVEVETDVLQSILAGKQKAVDAFLDDRLGIGGGNWPMVLLLLRLGQIQNRYGDYLSSNYVKAILK